MGSIADYLRMESEIEDALVARRMYPSVVLLTRGFLKLSFMSPEIREQFLSEVIKPDTLSDRGSISIEEDGLSVLLSGLALNICLRDL